MLASSAPREQRLSQPAAIQLNAFYRALWQDSDNGMYLVEVVDEETFRYAAFNPAITAALAGKCSILGQRPISQLVGRSLDECLILEVANQYRQYYRQCVEQRAAITFEKNFSTRLNANPAASGQPSYVCWQLTVYPIINTADAVSQLLITTTDITVQKQAEDALIETRQVWQQIIDTIPAAIFWKDRQSRYLGCNRGFLEIAGIETVAEIVGKNDYDMVWKPEESEWFRECDRRVMESNQPELDIVEPQLQANGRQAWLRTDKVPLHNELGDVTGVLGVIEDITDRKAVETVLRETVERQDVLNQITSQMRDSLDIDMVISTTLVAIHQGLKLDYSGFAWLYTDSDSLSWEIVQALDESERASIYGADPKDRLGVDIAQLSSLMVSRIDNAEDCDNSDHKIFLNRMGIRAEILMPFRTDDRRIGVLIGQHVHQSHRWGEEEIELLETVGGQLAIAINQANLYAQSCRQSQEVARTLEQLKKTQAQIIQAEKMSSLGQMVAGVAHEINNPVNFIHGNIEPAQEYIQDLLSLIKLYGATYPNPTPEIRAELEAVELDFVQEDLPKLLESMAVGTDRIREIVLSLRNFSRLDEAAAKTVDLHEGIDSTLVILSHKLKANEKNAPIEIAKHYGELPKVDCYPSQLNQVFMNIFANAVDALDQHEEPKITITTEQAGNFAIIRIADNGPGIPVEIQSQILDPFFTTKPVGKGTGMGMSISYQIVTEKHGGNLTFTSKVGRGTEFAIEIPLEQPDMD